MDNTELETKKIITRKTKNQQPDYVLKEDRTRFMVDVSNDISAQELIFDLLKTANNKEHGREVKLKDLLYPALTKLTPKDIEKIQEDSLTEMQKVEKALIDYNKKNNLNLSLGEYLVKKLGIH